MKKVKLKVSKLEVKSFVTSLPESKSNQLFGGGQGSKCYGCSYKCQYF